jgi:CheY-like chemotaxis protein
MLMHLDCDVAAAGDGAEAIEIFSTARESGQPFDAVIMDLTIPGGMGGKEAVSKILEIDPKARVIVSSGYSDDPVMADFRTHGFCAVLPKPYRIDELENVLVLAWKPAGTEPPPK